MEPRRRQQGREPPDLGSYGDYFSVEIHHDGFFCGVGKNRTYLDAKVDWFDYCDPDTWSLLWVEDFLGQLGYGAELKKSMRCYWCEPGKVVSNGLRQMKCDADMVEMTHASARNKNILIYVDHVNLLEKQNVDDVLIDGFKELPHVISPQKKSKDQVVDAEVSRQATARKKRVKLDLEGSSTCDPEGEEESEEGGEDRTFESDSELDSDFNDSDFEPHKGDDDLFANNVDKDVEDNMCSAKQIGKGKKLTCKGKGKVTDKGKGKVKGKRKEHEGKKRYAIDDVPSEDEIDMKDADTDADRGGEWVSESESDADAHEDAEPDERVKVKFKSDFVVEARATMGPPPVRTTAMSGARGGGSRPRGRGRGTSNSAAATGEVIGAAATTGRGRGRGTTTSAAVTGSGSGAAGTGRGRGSGRAAAAAAPTGRSRGRQRGRPKGSGRGRQAAGAGLHHLLFGDDGSQLFDVQVQAEEQDEMTNTQDAPVFTSTQDM